MTTLYGIKNCDTVKKARKYLDANNSSYLFHDFRVDGLELTKLQSWVDSVGWELLLNRRSTSWRQLTEQQKSSINSESAIKLMMDNPTLIKRPVLESADEVLVGFKEASYLQVI